MTATYTTPAQMTDGFLMTANYWNEQVTNNLDYAFARPLGSALDIDNTVMSTTSTTFVDVTGASVSYTPSVGRLFIIATITASGASGSSGAFFTFSIDGVDQGDGTYGVGYHNITGAQAIATILQTVVVTAATAHTIKIRTRSGTGTGITIHQFQLKVFEY